MDILMACSEVVSIVKVGGLADAVGALAKTLSRLGHKVTVALPRYAMLNDSGPMLARRLTPLKFEVDGETVDCALWEGRLGSDVDLAVIEVPGQFEDPWVYGPAGADDPNNFKRFGQFCRALAIYVEKRAAKGMPFDVVHAHDWPTALVPVLLRDADVRTMFTIHNGAHQGQFPMSSLSSIGLSEDDALASVLEHNGQLNLMKGAVLAADVVGTVSPTYARELQRPEGGAGLDDVFRTRGEQLVGIINGIDYARWSPSTDPQLPARYDAEAVGNKGRCKATLLRALELSIDPDRPLLVSLGRVCAQKGSDILAEAIPEIVATGARVVIAGEGDPDMMAALKAACDAAGADARYLGAVSETVSHRLLGAADAVLMPSRFEPCGLVQLHAQRYGAPPIAHAVGGLRDTIVDADAHADTGTGFLFDDLTSENLVAAVKRAVAIMHQPSWAKLRRRVMRQDHSWERPARRYARLYAPPA